MWYFNTEGTAWHPIDVQKDMRSSVETWTEGASRITPGRERHSAVKEKNAKTLHNRCMDL
jgi:hypothetical protein